MSASQDIPTSLIGLDREGLKAALAAAGVPAKSLSMRTNQLWNWIYVHGARDFAAMSNLAKDFRGLLEGSFTLARPEIVTAQVSQDGTRKWKGGRYGSGQLVLLADQDLLLVVSEEGELALVKAAPDQFTEVASKLPAIEGKTWNHPVVIGDLLLVRNGQEMAAFRLPLARGSTQ